jgi:multidrug efflux pump subunit AcrA (membrane-fusion protein)
MRYLWHAFFARPDIPLLRLPWNALAVLAAGVAGFWDPAIWGVATAGELIYLFTLASNPGFQQFISARATVEARGDTEDARRQLLSRVGGSARQRYVKLEEKRKRLEVLYRDPSNDDLFAESNADAMRRLTWLYLNLLVAQRNLIVAPSSDARDLEKQILSVERELAAAPSEAARASKDATIRLLRERLDNIQHKDTALAEIDADLARIETQLDYALEEATLRGRPTAISSHIELTSRLLTNIADEPATTYVPESQRTMGP